MKRFSERRALALMQEQGLTYGDLLRKVIMSNPEGLKPTSQYIQQILSGGIKNPGFAWVSAIAGALGVTTDELSDTGSTSVS